MATRSEVLCSDLLARTGRLFDGRSTLVAVAAAGRSANEIFAPRKIRFGPRRADCGRANDGGNRRSVDGGHYDLLRNDVSNDLQEIIYGALTLSGARPSAKRFDAQADAGAPF